jgi:lysyl-tRNA synthetase class 2
VPDKLPPGWPEESAQRLERARRLRALGIDPYPTKYDRTHTLAEVGAQFGGESLEELERLGARVRIAGRVLLKRGHGKASFLTLGDGEARLQVYVRLDDVGASGYALLELIDLGDVIGVAGRVMRTRKGELSVQAERDGLGVLSKALLPPPEKWHGLEDVEIRYRRRYLDLMANPEVRRAFLQRSAMIAELRRFMEANGYVEVETPMMQPIPGGALARPFKTHHNALGIDLYLRIAPELYLKRLTVGGLERVYEINRNFRNEGIDWMHNPEFTMLEFYTAYFDCQDVMNITERLISAAAQRVLGSEPARFRGREVSFQTSFQRLSMTGAIAAVAEEQQWGIDADGVADDGRLEAWLRSDPKPARLAPGSIEYEHCVADLSWEKYRALSPAQRIARLFEFHVERRWHPEGTRLLWRPTFVTGHPVEISPLAKARADEPGSADRFELFVAGMEIANGYSELNDPLEQRERFLDQLRQRERGDEEAHAMDEDYVRALGHGLPPTGGCGVGIDRLAMILTGAQAIRDVILFPHMRPADESNGGNPGRQRNGSHTGTADTEKR